MENEETFRLTASLEDYLEAIKAAIDETAHGHAHTSDIARRLQVKMPSVTNALGVREVLLLPDKEASDTACRVEHVIDDCLLSRLAVLTNALTDPHQCRPLRKALRADFAAIDAGDLDMLEDVYVPPPRPLEDPKRTRRRKPAQPTQSLEDFHDA